MSKTRAVWLVMCAVVAVVTVGSSPVVAASSDIELWKTEPASGLVSRQDGTRSIGGVVVEGYCMGDANDPAFVTWRVPDGYTSFECRCGIPDDIAAEGKPAKFEFLVDGDSIREFKTGTNEKPMSVRLPVRGGQSLRITFSFIGIVGEPRFTEAVANLTSTSSNSGSTSQESLSYWLKCPICSKQFDKKSALDEHIRNEHASKPAEPSIGKPPAGLAGGTYTITVEPRSLQDLAQKILAKSRADASTTGKILAVADFALIPSDSSRKLDQVVAQNAREDLSTAIGDDGRFKLVERGQLNEAIKSLKLDQSGLIDSATAKKLGKMVSADFVLIGSISDRGNFAVINARMIDAETGEMKYPASVEMRR